MPWRSIAHDCQEDDREVLASGRPKFQYEVCIEGAEGDLRWLLVSKVPIHDHGRTIGVLGTYDNVTARKLAEQERDALRVYLQNVFDSMPSVLISVDRQGRVNQWNWAAEQWTVTDRETMRERPFESVFPLLGSVKPPILRAITENRPWSVSRVPAKVHDKEIYCDIMVCPLGTEQGAVIRVDDVSELAIKEELLRQAQKMESVGQLAGGLAHDFNNALVGVKGGLSMLRLQLSRGRTDPAPLAEFVELAQNSVDAATEVVQRLLTLAKKQVTAFTTIDLRVAVTDVLKICEKTFPSSIELRVSMHDQALLIHADRVQIGQAVLNLCINAREAMTASGMDPASPRILSVYVGPVQDGDQRFRHHFGDAPSAQYVALAITDTGIGMDAATARRVFDPFFTTKGDSNGTGLGLSMVDVIVKQHKGAADLVSEPGKGATFTLYFARGSAGAVADVLPPMLETRVGAGLVLVADDYDNVRKTIELMLVDSGCQVLAARDGEEALAIFRERHAEIALVILDMVMPKLPGKEVFRAMLTVAPDVKVIITSGCNVDRDVEETLRLGARAFIRKPFTIHELNQHLAAILGGSPLEAAVPAMLRSPGRQPVTDL
jgi:signal transduction histidine kinase/CheY-like chemotaxis protein